ncbi:S-adenosyl-L-methionine-dependent methyltransferase [Pavlovales sp. CCMP2436]|nr:S-adenosyl-L-methionine-dependent methyltransferase [Pavlovales sp. CCMP2436]|mmetsp:Transcript_7435/g.19328  ORF Transcript_7435/g.19328 Transcript_7435/m.19328 type:complete len:492 (+) Transcript_7435:86-1561(+)
MMPTLLLALGSVALRSSSAVGLARAPLHRRCVVLARSAKAKAKEKEANRGHALVGQTVELQVSSLTSMGEGVARLPDGLVVIVPFVIPGERVLARIYRVSSYANADLLEVVTPAAERIAPVCAFYGVCGGCQYQHIPLSVQREWKRQHVVDALGRIGGFTDDPLAAAEPLLCAALEALVRPTLGAPEALAYGYRSKITPHHDAPKGDAAAVGAIGFMEASRRRILDVPTCPIASPAINAELPRVREGARASAAAKVKNIYEARSQGEKRRSARGATLLLRDAEGGVETDPRAIVKATVEGVTFEFPAGEFFQNNPSALPGLVQHVVLRARAGGRVDRLVDAYCGGGFFALCAAKHFVNVVGVEVSADNVAAARANAKRNGIGNALFEAGEVEAMFKPLVARGDVEPTRTTVILDPPRKGCSAEFLEQLFAFGPARVVYVSCDPATQARDAVAFAKAGYALREAQPFDLFPQTRHIECVCTFDRADAPPLPL